MHWGCMHVQNQVDFIWAYNCIGQTRIKADEISFEYPNHQLSYLRLDNQDADTRYRLSPFAGFSDCHFNEKQGINKVISLSHEIIPHRSALHLNVIMIT